MSPFTKQSLAFAAGFIDTGTFVHITGIFAAHVTGNIVIFAAELSRHHLTQVDYLKLITIPVFVVGVIIGSWLHGLPRGDDKTKPHLRLLMLQAGLILAFGLVALADDDPAPNATSSLDIVVVLGLVVTMGMQNALHRLVPGPMTTVMTGNLAQVIAATALKLRIPPAAKDAAPLAAGGIAWLILAFIAGCLASAFITAEVGMASVLLPGALILAASLLERGPHRRLRWPQGERPADQYPMVANIRDVQGTLVPPTRHS